MSMVATTGGNIRYPVLHDVAFAAAAAAASVDNDSDGYSRCDGLEQPQLHLDSPTPSLACEVNDGYGSSSDSCDSSLNLIRPISAWPLSFATNGGSCDAVSSVAKSSSVALSTRERAVRNWARALRAIHSRVDSWSRFGLVQRLPTEAAVRWRYNALAKRWTRDDIIVKLDRVSFARGAMRQCFRMKKLSNFSHSRDWNRDSNNYVAKSYIDASAVTRSTYFEDVRLQMEAKLWGEEYNRHNPPKKVDILMMNVVEMINRPGRPLYHVEHFLGAGEYVKYNSNSGFVHHAASRNTPHAFSHFTFERSAHEIMVVDIQGIGDLYTDPQIHTASGTEYGDGNLGVRGMALFFQSHRCNVICQTLGLSPFDLSPGEVRQLRRRISTPAALSVTRTSRTALDVDGSPMSPSKQHQHQQSPPVSPGMTPLPETATDSSTTSRGNEICLYSDRARELHQMRQHDAEQHAEHVVSDNHLSDEVDDQKEEGREMRQSFTSLRKPPVRGQCVHHRVRAVSSSDFPSGVADAVSASVDEFGGSATAGLRCNSESNACGTNDNTNGRIDHPKLHARPSGRLIGKSRGQQRHRYLTESSSIDSGVDSTSFHDLLALTETTRPSSLAALLTLTEEAGGQHRRHASSQSRTNTISDEDDDSSDKDNDDSRSCASSGHVIDEAAVHILGLVHWQFVECYASGRMSISGVPSNGATAAFSATAEKKKGDAVDSPEQMRHAWLAALFHLECAARCGLASAHACLARICYGQPNHVLPDDVLLQVCGEARNGKLTSQSGLDGGASQTVLARFTGLAFAYLLLAAQAGHRSSMVLVAKAYHYGFHLPTDVASILPQPLSKPWSVSLLSLLNDSTPFFPEAREECDFRYPVFDSTSPPSERATSSTKTTADIVVKACPHLAIEWYERIAELDRCEAECDELSDKDGDLAMSMKTDQRHAILAALADLYLNPTACDGGVARVSRDANRAGDLYTEAADLATRDAKGKLAARYYAAADAAYAAGPSVGDEDD